MSDVRRNLRTAQEMNRVGVVEHGQVHIKVGWRWQTKYCVLFTNALAWYDECPLEPMLPQRHIMLHEVLDARPYNASSPEHNPCFSLTLRGSSQRPILIHVPPQRSEGSKQESASEAYDRWLWRLNACRRYAFSASLRSAFKEGQMFECSEILAAMTRAGTAALQKSLLKTGKVVKGSRALAAVSAVAAHHGGVAIARGSIHAANSAATGARGFVSERYSMLQYGSTLVQDVADADADGAAGLVNTSCGLFEGVWQRRREKVLPA
jgi:hypothetical protein